MLPDVPTQSAKSSRWDQAFQEGRPIPPAVCGGLRPLSSKEESLTGEDKQQL